MRLIELLRAALLFAHFVEITSDAVVDANILAGHGMPGRNEGLGVLTEIQIYATALHSLDAAADQLADTLLVGLDNLRTLGLTHSLDDDLLGGLRGDAAELGRLHVLFNVIANLQVGIGLSCLAEANLAVFGFELDLFRVVGNDFPAAKRFVIAGLAVDRHASIDIFDTATTRRRCQRGLDRFEYDVVRKPFLVGNGFGDLQDFLALLHSSHYRPFPILIFIVPP